MKLAIIGDSHFGVKKNNSVFLNSQLRFFNERFFPYIEKNNIDTIIYLGDFWDNRNTININVLNEIDKLIIEQFNKYNTYILVGNHDTFMRSTIDIHSLKPFRHLKNITIVDETMQIDLDGKSCLLVPWQVDNKEFIKKVADKNLYNDLCFGHFEINGFNLNNTKVCDFGILPDVFFNNYGITFSGHFHCRKKLERDEKIIQYIGSPYELTRADINQEKGFVVLDTDTMKYEFINNNISIKHKQFTYPEEFKKEDIIGNIVDVVVDIGNDHDEKEFQKYMLEIDSYSPYTVDLKLLNNVDIQSKSDYNVQTTEELIEEYINDTDYDDKTKKMIIPKLNSLYKQCKQEG